MPRTSTMMIAIENSPVGETWPLIGTLLTKKRSLQGCASGPLLEWTRASLGGSCLHLPSFILSIEGLLQDIGQSLWEMIWRATKEFGPFGGPSEFSKHLDVEGQVLKQSRWGDVKREKELCVPCERLVLWWHLLSRGIEAPVGRWKIFQKRLYLSGLVNTAHPLLGLTAYVRKGKVRTAREQRPCDGRSDSAWRMRKN